MARNLLTVTFLAFLAYTMASPAIDGRIAGGYDAYSYQFPYQVIIYAFIPGRPGSLEDTFCSGSLISQNFVLTAARCLKRAQHVLVVLGSYRLDVFDSVAVKIQSSEFIIPKDFVSNGTEWDIALIKLSKPVELNDRINLIQLAEGPRDFVGEVAIVAGWGATSGAQSTPEPVLQWIETVVISHSQCVKYNPMFEEFAVEESHICQFVSRKSPCQGDRGAPLAVDGVQIGIASFIPSCAKGGLPVVYTRISHYIDWIRKYADI